MAKTYFEYADRLPDSQINWFQVGKDITDTIKKEDELRQKRKADTEAAFRKDIQELANAPQGNADYVNQWTLNYANDATEYLLQVNKLLKAGAIKPKDYNIINQNLKDGTTNLFNLSKEYQAEYEEKMKRAQPGGDGSAAEAQIMGMIEGFANLKDTKALINPTTGAISVGRMTTKDGVKVLSEGADNYMTVNQLRNRIKQKINKYQVNEDLKGEVDYLGDVVKEVVTKTGSSTQTGFMTKITDPTKRVGLSQEGKQAVDAYMQSEKDIINSKLTNPYNTSSILFDWSGGIDPKTKQPYQVVFDEKLANTSSHYVLYSFKDGVMQPDFDSTANGREQKKTAETYLTNKFRSMLEQKTEIQPFAQPRAEYAPAYVYERGDKAKAENVAGNMIAKLYSGTPAEQQAAITYFGGLPNVRSISRTNDGIVLTNVDGITKTIPFVNPATKQLMTQDDFIRSASSLLIGKDVDINKVLQGSLGTGNKQFAKGEASMTAESTNPNEMYGSYVKNKINTSLISTAKDNDTAEIETLNKVKPLVQALGFEAVTPSTFFTSGKFIEIKGPNDKTTGEIDLSKPDEAVAQIQSFLLANVPGKTEEEKLIFLSGLAKKGVLGGEQQKGKAGGVASKYN